MKSKLNPKIESTITSKLKLCLRVLLYGVGLGVLAGSTLKMIVLKQERENIVTSNLSKHQQKSFKINQNNSRNKTRKILPLIFFDRSRNQKELTSLSFQWRNLSERHKDIDASAFLLFIDNGKYAQLSPNKILPAASSIKIPILLATLQKIDSGALKWDERLKLTKDVIGGGAGWMAYQPLGKSFPTHEVSTEMIRVSDNTATNILIKRIGGINFLNQRFKALGLEATKINNQLPDLKGTNTTSAKDLAITIALVDQGKVLSLRSRDLFREVMSTSKSNRLLPTGLLKGLGEFSDDPDYKLMIKGYRVYNKTGDIGTAYADAGLIQLPNNTRVVATFIVKGPFNDPRSSQLIRDMAAVMAPFLRPTSQLP